jgi:hypothetical protein
VDIGSGFAVNVPPTEIEVVGMSVSVRLSDGGVAKVNPMPPTAAGLVGVGDAGGDEYTPGNETLRIVPTPVVETDAVILKYSYVVVLLLFMITGSVGQ